MEPFRELLLERLGCLSRQMPTPPTFAPLQESPIQESNAP